MTKFEMLNQTRNQLCEATSTYQCARNYDAGIIDKKVLELMQKALTALGKQMDKNRK